MSIYEDQKTYEQLRTCALNCLSLAADDEAEDFTRDFRDYQLSRAQVYATLALAAATVRPEIRFETRVEGKPGLARTVAGLRADGKLR